ncbi:MAG: hypothetical protein AAFX01_07885 [Cyanobacteria bacterium J06638_28]
MTTKSISTEISESVLEFAPEKAPVSFDITVDNDSRQFASFQVSLVAPGIDPNQRGWYQLFPSVSAKIPPGDRAQFQAQLLTVPPVPGGFTGTMNLTVKVYSTELRDEDRQDLRLIITGEGLLPPKLTIPDTTFKAQPQEQVEVLTKLYNPNRKSIEVLLEVAGLNPLWLPDGTQRTVTLLPAEEKRVTFLCKLPAPVHAPNGVHPFTINLIDPAPTALPPQLLLEVLPQGHVEFQCDPLEQWIPAKAGRWLNPFDSIADYTLTFHNRSNMVLTGEVQVVDEEDVQRQQRQRRLPRFPGRRKPVPEAIAEAETLVLPTGFALEPAQAVVEPGAVTSLHLTAKKSLPWLGWARLQRVQVQASLADSQLDLRNDSQTLELHILPIIPVLWQALGGLLGLFLLGLLWWVLTERGHTSKVNSVQFNGIGTEVVSSANDQTIRRWRVSGRRLVPQAVLERGDKAIRVVTYRPFNNDWIASGFENGAIQVQSLLSGTRATLELERDDRVFDLVFDRDARALWSAHGSGRVLRWGLNADLGAASSREPQQTIEADFAVSALSLVGEDDALLAVGGRNQQFALVDLEAGEAFDIPYRNGTQTDFITSLATAEEHPDLLAVSDSQGFVSLWNLANCLSNSRPCEPIDEWQAHGGDAVRSVALSADGCYLASAGDDGRVWLWFLTGAGERRPDQLEGRPLQRSNQPLNTVDMHQQERRLSVVSGGDDSKVRLRRVRVTPDEQCGRRG